MGITTGWVRGGLEVGVEVSALALDPFEPVEMAEALRLRLLDRAELTSDGRSTADDRGVLRGVARGVKAGTASSSADGHRNVDLDECAEQ